MVTGTTSEFGGTNDRAIWLLKTDDKGNVIVNKTFDGTSLNDGWDSQVTSDGGFIIVSYDTVTEGSREYQIWIIKTDGNGNEEWAKFFGEPGYDEIGYTIYQTSDNGYIIGGTSYLSEGKINKDGIFLKIDQYGTLQWKNYYGGTDDEYPYDCLETKDGEYLFTGYVSDKTFLVKTDTNGNILWNKTFNDFKTYSLDETKDGGYVLAGFKTYDIVVMKTDKNGTEEWKKIISSDQKASRWPPDIQTTPDGGFIVAGDTQLNSAGDRDVWVIKLSPDSTGTDETDETNGNDDTDGSSENDDTGVKTDSPGFELFFILIAITLVIFIKRKRV